MNKEQQKQNFKAIKDEGFRVPEDFFEQSKKNILNEIKTQKEVKTKIISLKETNFRYVIGIAAAILVVFVAITNFSKNTDLNEKIVTASDTITIIKKEIHGLLEPSNEETDEMALFVEDAMVDEYLENIFIEAVAFE